MKNWQATIMTGEVVIEGTLHGDREILVATQPDGKGNFEGHIISGADSDRPRERFSFSIAVARAVRIAGQDDYARAGLQA